MTWSAVALFVRRLAGSAAFRYLAGACAVALLLYAFHTWSFRKGEASKEAEYETAIQEERERQAELVREAVEDAENRIRELETAVSERDEILQDILRDTDGMDNPAVSRDGVRLLNRIR